MLLLTEGALFFLAMTTSHVIRNHTRGLRDNSAVVNLYTVLSRG